MLERTSVVESEGLFRDVRWIVRQIEEQRDALHTPILLKVLGEESRRLQIHPHSAEHNRKVILMIVVRALIGVLLLHEPRLPTNLRRDLVVRQAGGAEDGDLLAARDAVHGVDGADAGGDHLLGVDARVRVDGRAVDVEVVFSQHLGAFVDCVAAAVESPAEHVFAHAEFEVVASEFHARLCAYPSALLDLAPHRLGMYGTFFTSIPGVPSNTCTTARFPVPQIHQPGPLHRHKRRHNNVKI